MLSDSKFGFGLMRLPKDANNNIDIDQVKAMVDGFMASGFNYFDTAYVYKGSEEAMKAALVDRYPRESYTIANKIHKMAFETKEQVAEVFNESLRRCGVDYFDFYLIHAINRKLYGEYQEFGCFEYCQKQKEAGKIRYLGFSFHDDADLLDQVLTEHPEIDFVQLQLNYLDWDSGVIQARKNYEVARRHNKPIVVMEPIKGGNLAVLPDHIEKIFKDYNPEASMASWALRYVGSLDGVMTILSGMSTPAQMADNLATMKDFEPINAQEASLIAKITKEYLALKTIDCTACRYCVAGCPKNILIPDLFAAYNDQMAYGKTSRPKTFYLEHTGDGHGLASDCIACGKCEQVCPQHLPIVDLLKKVAATFE